MVRSHESYAAGLRRRRAASWRLPVLESGYSDPWRYDQPEEPSEQYVNGYRDAVKHLFAHGLTPAPNLPVMRIMWRCGGDDQRLASHIAELWEVA